MYPTFVVRSPPRCNAMLYLDPDTTASHALLGPFSDSVRIRLTVFLKIYFSETIRHPAPPHIFLSKQDEVTPLPCHFMRVLRIMRPYCCPQPFPAP